MNTLRALALAGALGLAAPAQAQYYAVQPQQPYAIEVAPGTFVIRNSAVSRSYPYVGCGPECAQPNRPRPAVRYRTHNDRALIEELRRKQAHKNDRKVMRTTKVVRDAPVVVEHRRVVDDPPRVIERVRFADKERKSGATANEETAPPGPTGKRVIRADAEVTILGPDRMSIRLFRKPTGTGKARAEAED